MPPAPTAPSDAAPEPDPAREAGKQRAAEVLAMFDDPDELGI